MRQSQEYRRQWVHTSGDGLIIYPGRNVTPLPSIRLEVIRDGIEDFEYLSLLEELTAKVKQIALYNTPEGRTVEYVGWWPNPLLPAKDFNVPADIVQPLWFTVTTPPNAKAGVYQGSIVIDVSNYQKEIPLRIHVRNFTLPRPGKLAAPFGVYMNTVAEWYYGEGKKLKIEDFKKWCKF